MPRARTKDELIEFSQLEEKRLFEQIDTISRKLELEDNYLFDNRKPKDIVAHLLAWHGLMENWYVQGMKGEHVEIPAKGYTFKDAPRLNEDLFQEYKDIPLQEILEKFKASSKRMIKFINNHTDEELFEKKKYKWTGTTSMGSYFASATSSHYVWANDLLKKFIKNNS